VKRVVVALLLVTVAACDPIRSVAVTVRSVPALGPIGGQARRLAGAEIRQTCPGDERGAGTMGITDGHGELDWHALGTLDGRCSVTARADGHYEQSVRIRDAQGGRAGRHSVAVQFDLVSQDAQSTVAPPAARTVPVSFAGTLDRIEVRALDHRRSHRGLSAEPRLCITPDCMAVQVPVGRPIVVARAGDAAALDAPVLFDRASTVNIHYVDHSKARWARRAFGVVALAGLAALLVGITAERTDVILGGAGVFGVSLGTGLSLPWDDEARLDVRSP
jgi:hypothetical protein